MTLIPCPQCGAKEFYEIEAVHAVTKVVMMRQEDGEVGVCSHGDGEIIRELTSTTVLAYTCGICGWSLPGDKLRRLVDD